MHICSQPRARLLFLVEEANPSSLFTVSRFPETVPHTGNLFSASPSRHGHALRWVSRRHANERLFENAKKKASGAEPYQHKHPHPVIQSRPPSSAVPRPKGRHGLAIDRHVCLIRLAAISPAQPAQPPGYGTTPLRRGQRSGGAGWREKEKGNGHPRTRTKPLSSSPYGRERNRRQK